MSNLPEELKQYFAHLNNETVRAYELAKHARKAGYDPALTPEIQIAKNMAERVVGLVSILAPQVVGSGIDVRIQELEAQYGILDWRVAFQIALEVAQQKFCAFEDEREAIEVGIRIGFAYATNGVVSSPLEGFVNLELITRQDGKGKFFRINYAGPVRNAGGTAAAVSVLIADYVRKHMNYAEYDPTEDEVKRCYSEISMYHERVTNLQYFPSEEEMDFLVRRMPVEVAGDPTEKVEVPNYKNLPRIPTNKIRSGFCLIYSSCIPLKAPKLWKQLSKWGSDMGMDHWNFLEEFITVQKKNQAKGQAKSKDTKVSPNFTYIADLVAGRPVFGHPLRPGGFRLRYGRSRLSGLSGQSIHPATMIVANEFIATASQLKVERPGKAAAYTACDTIQGPVVLLTSGEVVEVTSSEQAKKLLSSIKRVLFLGDILICYGDFLDRAHMLIPPGYCEEWWVQELKQAGCDVPKELWENPQTTPVSFEKALSYAKEYSVPLHPRHTFYYKNATVNQLRLVWEAVRKAPHKEQLIFRNTPEVKQALEVLCVPHKLVQDFLVMTGDVAQALKTTFSREAPETCDDPMLFMQEVSPVFIRDKAGVYVGARLGRPEKAKMRKLTGSPHTLFPVGEEGGRLRSFNAALEAGRVTSNFQTYLCTSCKKEVVNRRCHTCDSPAQERYWSPDGQTSSAEQDDRHPTMAKRVSVPIKEYFDACLERMDTRVYPDLIKGVRGTMNEDKTAEHIFKGFLRARHEVHVNKDGTIRYDASEVPVTHFRPSEIGISAARAKELGYVSDIHGNPIEHDDQVIEIFPQDVILPACDESPDEKSDDILLRAAQFVDELLVHLYGMEPYYNAKTSADLIGHFVIALAPHTSAGTIGRIIGFSKTQGLFYHPYLHCATRRDCFTHETSIPLFYDGSWHVERIGDVVERLNPTVPVDVHGTTQVIPKGVMTLGVKNGNVVPVPVESFTKHTPMPIVAFETKLGKKLRTTKNHKHVVIRNGKERVVRAEELRLGDIVKLPYKHSVPEQDTREIDLIQELSDKDWLMVRGLREHVPKLRSELLLLGASERQADNYSYRDSVPVSFAKHICKKYAVQSRVLRVSAKRDHISLPASITLTDEFLSCLGLYVAEGFSRVQEGGKGSYQVYIAAGKKQIRDYIKDCFGKLGLVSSENKRDRVTYSSRILFTVFTEVLGMGRSAYEKRLPARLLNLPKRRLGKLLAGYFEGDGSVSTSDLRVVFDTVSDGLMRDMEFALGRLGIFVKYRTSTRQPGKPVQAFYERKGRDIPYFTCTRGVVQSKFAHQFSEDVVFLSEEKQVRQQAMLKRKFKYIRSTYDDTYFYDQIISLENQPPEESYCLTVPNHLVVANGILTRQCDGDEGCVFLIMDAFLNFSKKYLPSTRGGTMDAPLVLTTVLVPAEVDDMVLNMDIAWRYPLEFYRACEEFKMPWEVKIPIVNHVLNTPEEFYGMGFTHDCGSINDGNHCSAYKTLPSMQEKLESQMDLAEKLVSVDERDVARLVIEKHFIRDLKGNLRKFSMQAFRCVKCNESYRRPPLRGNCSCGGRIIFTISEGSVVKYLTPAESLVEKYNLDTYLAQTIELTRRRVEEVFGKDPEKQLGLGEWFT